MIRLSTSVIVATYGRAERLNYCLASLALQTQLPDEVIVVWQGNDIETKQLAENFAKDAPFPFKVVHQPEPGIVPAENAGLDRAAGEIILLIDDDAIAAADWLQRHITHYEDPSVGAVGASCQNFSSDDIPVNPVGPRRIGKLTWFGRFHGNMQDLLPAWRTRRPIAVNSLIGGNMSFRRNGLGKFDSALKPYWHYFEADACLQVARRGFRILFDFGNPVRHYPVHRTTIPERLGDEYRVYNLAYNHAYILSKHSPWWLRAPRIGYLILMGTATRPGCVGALVAFWQHGNPQKQLMTFRNCVRWHLKGWVDGSKNRCISIAFSVKERSKNITADDAYSLRVAPKAKGARE